MAKFPPQATFMVSDYQPAGPGGQAGGEYALQLRIIRGPKVTGLQTVDIEFPNGVVPQNLVTAQSRLSVDPNGSQEFITPTGFDGPRFKLTANFTQAHPDRCLIVSGTNGLQEAINDALGMGGGLVYIDPLWYGTDTDIGRCKGNNTVGLIDLREGQNQAFNWNGSSYSIAR